MSRSGVAATLLAAALVGAVGAAEACREGLSGAAGLTVKSSRYVLAYRTEPARIAVGEHFSLDVLVCPRTDVPRPESVRVDAHMPEHRHGMNYRPAVTAQGDGRYRAEGLLFHMPGHWELVFEVRAAGRTDRLTRSVELE